MWKVQTYNRTYIVEENFIQTDPKTISPLMRFKPNPSMFSMEVKLFLKGKHSFLIRFIFLP